jgi:hypothetical protein
MSAVICLASAGVMVRSSDLKMHNPLVVGFENFRKNARASSSMICTYVVNQHSWRDLKRKEGMKKGEKKHNEKSRTIRREKDESKVKTTQADQ